MSDTTNILRCVNCGFVGGTVWTGNGGPYCGTCAKWATGETSWGMGGPPLTYPLAGRPEDLAEIARLRAEVENVSGQRDDYRKTLGRIIRECASLAPTPEAGMNSATNLDPAEIVREWKDRAESAEARVAALEGAAKEYRELTIERDAARAAFGCCARCYNHGSGGVCVTLCVPCLRAMEGRD